MHWKTLESEYISRHPYFTARRDRCQREDGIIIDPYYVVELPTSATALPVTEDGKIVLIRQYRHPVNEIMIETPGGFIDEGEDFVTGMQRELLEETGYHFNQVEHVGRAAANPGLLNNYTEFFLATGGKKTSGQSLDRNEEIDIIEVSFAELRALLMEGKIGQSLHVSCIFFALERLQQLKLLI